MKVYITGIGGLIGSAVAEAALAAGHEVAGVDSDARGRWFGSDGSVEWRLKQLEGRAVVKRADFRACLYGVVGADLVVHCASQPSHDLSRRIVIEDSMVNYIGTVQLLDAVRDFAPEATFVLMSTNKVYGDGVNRLVFTHYDSRIDCNGVMVGENWPIDATTHTPFGVSKLAADVMTQEYSRTFGLTTVVLRCGCMTGVSGSPVELQGFLGWLVHCAVWGKPYTLYGDGRQVRDNIAAEDVASAIMAVADQPKSGVYNLGGGRESAVSVLEAVEYLRREHGLEFHLKHAEPRHADHRWWITSNYRFMQAYPNWRQTHNVWGTIDAMVRSERSRRADAKGYETVPTSFIEETGFQFE